MADESGISNDRYMLVGALTTSRNNVGAILNGIERLRSKVSMPHELKWQKVCDSRESEYKTFIDAGLRLLTKNQARFDMICFDNSIRDHKKYNEGDSDIGLNKMYYQLLLHRAVRYYGKKGGIHIRLDARNSSTPLSSLKDMLNNGARNIGIENGPVKVLESTSSKNCDLLQLNDVLLGAFSAYRNNRLNGRPSKARLAQHVFEKSGFDSLDEDSDRTKKLTFWNFKPSK